MQKYEKLINRAKDIMGGFKDPEHSLNHIYDVLNLLDRILEKMGNKYAYNKEVCYISVWWHDVGRSIEAEGHEKLSAEMLKKEMIKDNYDEEFIESCYKAIVHHKWNMKPETIEGEILRDADKLAWIGLNRWEECLDSNFEMDSILNLLPKLRNDVIYFNESKEVYDELIIEFINLLYKKLTK